MKSLQTKREMLIRQLCVGYGFAANLHLIKNVDLRNFNCANIEEFETLVTQSVSKMKEMVGIETEALAIECALALDGGSEGTLTERRTEFLYTEAFSYRTLIRKEVVGVKYLLRTFDKINVKQDA